MSMKMVCLVIAGFTVAAWGADELHNFGQLSLAAALPDSAAFGDEYQTGFGGALGYGTRLGRETRFFAYGLLGYDRFQSRNADGNAYLYNFNADARWYFGVPTKEISGYVGLGPGVYWAEDKNAYFGGNIAVGGDFPVGNDWAITADIDQHFVNADPGRDFATFRIGAAYWFF
jgi:hypothetical protein